LPLLVGVRPVLLSAALLAVASSVAGQTPQPSSLPEQLFQDELNLQARANVVQGSGARALGMGGAFLAVADDATAAYWNPAGINYLKNNSLVYMHSEEQHSQVHYDYLAAVLPQGGEAGKRSAIGVSLVRLGVDDIPVTPSVGALRPGIDFQDDDGDPTTNLPTEHNGVWDPGERLFISDFELKSSNDFAGLFSYARDLTTTFMSWDTGTRESIPPSLSLGGQWTHHFSDRNALTLAGDVRVDDSARRIDSNFGGSKVAGELHGGAEYWFHNSLALRTGVNGRDLTFGAGIRNKGLGVDVAAMFNRFFETDGIAFAGNQDQGVAYRVSGSYDW